MKTTRYVQIQFEDLAVEMTVRALVATMEESRPHKAIEGKVLAVNAEKKEFTIQDGLLDKDGTVVKVEDELVELERLEEVEDAEPAAETAEYAAPVPAPAAAPEPEPAPKVIESFADLSVDQRHMLLLKLIESEDAARAYLETLIKDSDDPTDIGPARRRARIMVEAKDVAKSTVEDTPAEGQFFKDGEDGRLEGEEPEPAPQPIPAPVPAPAAAPEPEPVREDPPAPEPERPEDEEEPEPAPQPRRPSPAVQRKIPGWLKAIAGIVLALIAVALIAGLAYWARSDKSVTDGTTAKKPVPTAPAPADSKFAISDPVKWVADCVQLGGTKPGCESRLAWIQGK